MSSLLIPRMKIKVKVPENLVRLGISCLIEKNIILPSLSILNLSKLETKQLLIDLHSCLGNVLHWEILPRLLGIKVVFLFKKHFCVVSLVPLLENSIWVFSVFSLQLCQLLDFLLGFMCDQIKDAILEVLDSKWSLGHSLLNDHFGEAGVPKDLG